MQRQLPQIVATFGEDARLSRRRDRQASQEAWLIYYGDVCAGSIGLRSGNPTETNPLAVALRFLPRQQSR
jgi:hypothetical protein